MTEEIREHLNIIGAIGLGFCGIEIFGLMLSCALYIKLKHIYEDWQSSVDSNRIRNPQNRNGFAENRPITSIYYGEPSITEDDEDGVFPIDISLWWGNKLDSKVNKKKLKAAVK